MVMGIVLPSAVLPATAQILSAFVREENLLVYLSRDNKQRSATLSMHGRGRVITSGSADVLLDMPVPEENVRASKHASKHAGKDTDRKLWRWYARWALRAGTAGIVIITFGIVVQMHDAVMPVVARLNDMLDALPGTNLTHAVQRFEHVMDTLCTQEPAWC